MIILNVHDYWEVTLAQDAVKMKEYFHSNAYICWHNSNERFTVDEFIRANCEYPGHWDGEIKRIEQIDDLVISAVHVFSTDDDVSLHVVSFMKIMDDKIAAIDEYWGDDGIAPKWRLDKHIGRPIQ